MTALAVRPDGTLIAGTTPGGRVYTVDPKSGKSKLFATLTAEHVWALALDAKSGTVYAGTGGPGKISAIDAGGTRARHLGLGRQARRVADRRPTTSTSTPAPPRRRSSTRSASTAAPRRWPTSTPRRCARWRAHGGVALRRGQRLRAVGGIAAADAGRRRRAARHARSPSPPSGSPASAGSLPRPGQRKAKAALYRIDPDGRMEQMFSIPDGYFTSLAFDDERPRLRRHRQRGPRLPRRRRSHRRAGDRRARAAGADAAARRQRLPGRHRRRGRRLPRRARGAAARRPTCRACSTASTGRAGACSAGTARTTSRSRAAPATPPSPTRPGPASRALEKPRPTAEGGVGQVASPPARYVQYRATFGAPEGRLAAVTLAYLPQNQRARITELGPADSGGARRGARRPGRAGGEHAAPAAPRAHQPVHQAALEGGEPRRRRAELPARVPRRRTTPSGARSAAPTRSPRPTTTGTPRGCPTGPTSCRVTASDERSEPRERALETTLHVRADPGRQPQARGRSASP